MLAQRGLDIADRSARRTPTVPGARRVEKAAADAAGLGQLQAQVAQVAATVRAKRDNVAVLTSARW
jgi:hypothetical protein